MNTRSCCPVMWTLVAMLVVTGVVGAAGPPRVGIEVDVEPWLFDLGTVVVTVRWDVGGDEAFVALNAPEGVEAVVEGGRTIASGDRQPLGAVSTGQNLTVEIFGLADGQEAFLAVERRAGDESFQLVTTIGFDDDRPIVIDAKAYRIYHKEVERRGNVNESADAGDRAVTAHPTERTVVVESLQPKTAAVLFADDPANMELPISPAADCQQATHQWKKIRQVNIDAASAGSVTTAISIHVIMTHADAGQVQLGYSEDDYYWDPAHLYYGVYLWKDEGSQVDLDEVWTRDKYNNELPGIGRDPNGWFQLWLVDCTGGDIGTLDYWSVEVTYDTSADVDLLADNVSVTPGTAASEDDVEVVWEGHIAGTDSVAGGFTTRIYLSSDTNITTADTVLATVHEAAASDPGDDFGDDPPGRTVTLPGGLSDGAMYIGIIVDYDNVVDESNESNNTAWDGITIDSSSSVDLVADSITPQSGSVAAGSSVNVNWFGHLDGGSSGDVSGNFSVGFYLSQDASVTTADTLLDRATIVGPTSPGESFGANGRSLLIPGPTAAGTWYLGMIVDDTGSVAETDENNNIASSAITVTGGGGQADLVTSACSVNPSSVEAGGSVTVSWTEQNQGTEEAPAFVSRVYLSSNTALEPGTDVQVKQLNLGPYPAGHVGQLSNSVTIPGGTADGNWYLLSVTDDDNDVAESDENNNMCYSSLSVGSGDGPGISDRWLVPAAASAPGYNSSDWRTQLAITNPSDQSREASVYYVSDASSWPGVLLTGPVTVGARRSYYLDDLLLTLRPTAGLLYVVLDALGPVVTSRTYNRAADGSTFGQGIPGIPLISGQVPDELILPMVHSGAGRFHTNLGLVQASTGSMTVEISIYTSGGSLLANQQRTVSDGWDQINDVFDKMGVGAAIIEGGWIKVRLISGSPDAWTCYASVVDKETGDPTYVAGVEAE